VADYPYHLTITSSVSPGYGTMQKGLTDCVCILGFADCLHSYNEDTVYRVHDINDALVEFTGTDTYESSLIQGMMEVYTGGCRDIYLYPIAPMSSYLPAAERDESFYTDLYTYYESALNIINNDDEIEVLIPYDADISEGEFVNLFATHCQNVTGDKLRMVYFSYNGEATETFTGEDFHVVLVNGQYTLQFPDIFENAYTCGMAAMFAGMVSRLDTDVPPDNRAIDGGMIFESDYDDIEETLEANRIVGFRKTVGYKRVSDGSLVSTLSYTRAPITSDFGSLYVVHLLQRFIGGVDRLELIGTPAHSAQDSLKSYFSNWVRRGYATNIESSYKITNYTLYVNVILHLPYPIGSVSLNFIVGPVY